MDESSYDEYDRRNMPPSQLFELLLQIKESVGNETFLDALALIQTTPPPPHPGPGGACREEHGNEEPSYRQPNCDKNHIHPIAKPTTYKYNLCLSSASCWVGLVDAVGDAR
jgi:hypothetical protein